MITDEMIAEMKQADADGKTWAENLRVGEIFMGARPEAERRGYKTSMAVQCFSNAALDVLDGRWLSTDRQGIITRYELRTSQGD